MNAHTFPIRAFALTDEDRAERAREEAWEANREECFDEFTDWQRADYDRREFEDFGNWLASKARWNAPNKYGEAMNWQERGSVEPARVLTERAWGL